MWITLWAGPAAQARCEGPTLSCESTDPPLPPLVLTSLQLEEEVAPELLVLGCAFGTSAQVECACRPVGSHRPPGAGLRCVRMCMPWVCMLRLRVMCVWQSGARRRGRVHGPVQRAEHGGRGRRRRGRVRRRWRGQWRGRVRGRRCWRLARRRRARRRRERARRRRAARR